MTRLVVLQSNPSVLCPAALPPLLELGASPAAEGRLVSDNGLGGFETRTVVDGELGHGKRSGVGDAVNAGGGVENFDVLSNSNKWLMEIFNACRNREHPILTVNVPDILILVKGHRLINHMLYNEPRNLLHHRVGLGDAAISTLAILMHTSK
jgi:hypothetical protein